jgi:hypothetical protein
MRLYLFRSDANMELRAFAADLTGSKLPAQFRPWHAVGAVAAGNSPPYQLDRKTIEQAISKQGFQLWRMKRKEKVA